MVSINKRRTHKRIRHIERVCKVHFVTLFKIICNSLGAAIKNKLTDQPLFGDED